MPRAALGEGLGERLRRHDPDRYLTTLFAPEDRRGGLLALYSFNFEVAKIREVVREPMLGEIRLQWWREAIGAIYSGGPVRPHEVSLPLAETVRRFDLTRYHFDRLIDARGADLEEEPPANLASLRNYAENTSSRLIYLALEILGGRDNSEDAGWQAAQEAAGAIGIAWALIGTIRALPAHIAAGRRVLPAELLQAAGIDPEMPLSAADKGKLARAVEILAAEAEDQLTAGRKYARSVPRVALPALLPGVLARAHLRRLQRAQFQPFDPKLLRPDGFAAWRLAMASLAGRFW